jgi:hypothetical protein
MNSQSHLTHKQLCDLVIASPLDPEAAADDTVHTHLHSCYTCMAELTALTGTLDQFQTVAHTVTGREFNVQPRAKISLLAARKPAFRWMQPLSFALAIALLVAVALPFTLTQHHPAIAPQQAHIMAPVAAPAANAISDEALLEGVDQDLSASIPDSMQPLADPTATAATTTSTQRIN